MSGPIRQGRGEPPHKHVKTPEKCLAFRPKGSPGPVILGTRGRARPILWAVSTSFLVLDIETVLDPELPIVATARRSACHRFTPHHKVVVLGALLFDAAYEAKRINVISELKRTEAGILEDFARMLEERRPCLVTFNGRGFDMPVIAARCLRHGIPFRHYFRSRDVRYRFSAEGHLDLMDYVSDFGAAKPSKLDIIAKLVTACPAKWGSTVPRDVGPMVHMRGVFKRCATIACATWHKRPACSCACSSCVAKLIAINI